MFRLYAVNFIEITKLVRSRRLIFLKFQLQNALNISDEIWNRKLQLPQVNNHIISSERIARDALNHLAVEANLKSDHDTAQYNFRKAGQIGIDLLQEVGLKNTRF